MSTRKTSLFYAVLIAIASHRRRMVIASRLDLTPASSAQTVAVPPMNSAPLAGAIDATTFRNIAKTQIPTVVNIRTESRAAHPGPDRVLRAAAGAAATTCCGGSSAVVAAAPDSPQDGAAGRGGVRPRRISSTQGPAPGFIIDKAGFILTNNHVVDGAEKIRCRSSAPRATRSTRPRSSATTR